MRILPVLAAAAYLPKFYYILRETDSHIETYKEVA